MMNKFRGSSFQVTRLAAVLACGLILCGIVAGAHAQEAKLSFDVAALRQNKTGLPPSGDIPESNVPLGPGDVYSPTGGLLRVKNYPLISYVSFAYRLNSGQRDVFEAAAPGWVLHDRFNLQARTEKQNVTKDELRLMMRSLLADRFGMAVHYETRVTSVFAMLLIKPGTPGPRLRPHSADGCSRSMPRPEAVAGPAPSEAIDGGYPVICGGLLMLSDSTPTHFHIGARDVPITSISNALPSWGDLGRPVVDQTGLTGNYDFALEFTPKRGDGASDAAAPTEENEPNFLDAMKKQLGLKLEAQKQGVQVLVLDHVDRLSEN
jgi:uncharacterized protein (TIGR03435 family)